MASTLVSYLPAFPFSAKATIRMVRKLDLAFTHLLQLDDSNTLAGLHPEHSGLDVNQRKIVSRTDRVRIKSVCEMTRNAAIESSQKTGVGGDDFSESETDEDDEEPDDDPNHGPGTSHGDFTMGIAGMYESTLGMIGDSLEGLDQPNTDQTELDLDLPMASSGDEMEE